MVRHRTRFARVDDLSRMNVASGLNVLAGLWLIATPWIYARFTPNDAKAYGATIDFSWGTGSATRVVSGTGTNPPPDQR